MANTHRHPAYLRHHRDLYCLGLTRVTEVVSIQQRFLPKSITNAFDHAKVV
jgi:hypothetical protein